MQETVRRVELTILFVTQLLNAMIDGINTLSDKIMKKKLIKKKIPKLSTGTGANPGVQTDSQGRLTKPTKAIVNDKGLGNASGSRGHKELIYRRNGKIEQPRGNNKRVSLKRGDAVYNGMQSKAMLPHLSTGTIGKDMLKKTKKHHKHDEIYGDVSSSGGGGGNPISAIADGAKGAWSWTADKAKKAKDSFGKAIGDVWDYASNPMKLINKMLKHFGVNFDGIGGAMGGTISWAYDSLKKGLKDLVTGWFDDGEGDGGYIDLSKGINFPYSPHGRAPGYPFPYPHMGIDLNYIYDKLYSVASGLATAKTTAGGFGKHVSIKSGAMEYIYGHMSKFAFGGSKKVKPGDYLGVSGNTGMSSGPHLHFEVRKNGTPIDPLKWLKENDGGGKGGKSGKWTGDVKKALKIAGLPQTSEYINAWKRQIQTESSGNPRAEGPGSSEGTPKGLVQVKSPTFNAYKAKGHGNIWNGLDNLIAGMRYAKATYGPKGMLKQIGRGLPYKTGGIINTDGTYHLADGGYPEAVLSLDPNRASDTMKLMNYVQSKIGTSDKKNKRPNQIPNRYASTSQSNNSAELNMMAQQLQATQEQNNLLMQLLGVTKNIEGQPKGFNERDVSQAQGDRARMKKFNLGM